MKSFRFRLAAALRWREQQVLLQEARLAAARGRIAAIESARREAEKNTAAAAHGLLSAGSGMFLNSYAGYLHASGRQARILVKEEKTARAEYAAEMTKMIAANQKMRLLENLRESARRAWQSEVDREVADFAAEAFLSRHSALRHSRPRSSGDAAGSPGRSMPAG